ncbi:MAG: phosphate ABC transporter ATP-binding protein [Candidatus Dormibacteraeota bacterium]|nr:phosphate ABC transporter ATP-binding protein [Candidatus Dormibacteraeota bacterium]
MTAGYLSIPTTATAQKERSSSAAVRVRGLSVKLASRTLIDDVSVTFPEKRITAIVGPTGCGKTTLLRSINRMHDHSPGITVSGDITVGDTHVYGATTHLRELRRRVGMLFQRANPFPQSIEDNVGIAPRAHGMVSRRQSRELVEQQLIEVGLWEAVKDRLSSSPFTLSGGQQQLLCLARTLALSPEVLLLDEPTSALDPGTTEHIEALLKRLRERMTILIVTHNLSQALRISDEVAFFMAGKLVEHATSNTFFHEAADQRSRDYVSGRVG